MSTNELIFLGIGIIGASLILIAFIEETRGIWKGATWQYELLNFLGACGLGIYGLTIRAYPNIVLNATWAIVAALSLWRMANRRPKSTPRRKGH